MTLDPLTRTVFVAMNRPMARGIVYKLHMHNLLLYGTLRLQEEVAEVLLPAPRLRRVLLLATVALKERALLTLPAFAVTGVRPDLAEVVGGTEIRVCAVGMCLES